MTTPTNAPPDLSRWAPSIQGYAEWIVADDLAEAREWEHRINQKTAAHVEGAIAEAVAWAYLFPRVDSIRRFPPSASGRKRPDFLCRAGGEDVVVEVMNLSRDHVTRITGLNDPIVIGAGMKSYQPWDRALKNVLTRKSAQGTSLTSPYVVFVTTLHWEASVILCDKSHVEMLLHSRSHMRGFIDEHGDPVGEVEVVTDMATAAFTRKNTLVAARQHVSAMLVGGFGTYPDVRVLGVLHPEALHPLPRAAFSETPLCYWRRWPPAREVEIAWTDDSAP